MIRIRMSFMPLHRYRSKCTKLADRNHASIKIYFERVRPIATMSIIIKFGKLVPKHAVEQCKITKFAKLTYPL